MVELSEWSSFYVIVGSSAGALIGLQFVVITLIANRPVDRGSAQASAAFSTPSVVHFAVVLLLSAVVSVPWQGITAVAIIFGLVGLCGLVYTVVVLRRMRRQPVYKPVFEDWLFHVLLPLVSYATLAAAPIVAHFHARPALFLVAAAALLLLFVGIHNAWDTVTHLVYIMEKEKSEKEQDH